MDDGWAKFWIGVAVGACLALWVGVAIGGARESSIDQRAAIRHGAAQYNAQTGAFEWKTEETK